MTCLTCIANIGQADTYVVEHLNVVGFVLKNRAKLSNRFMQIPFRPVSVGFCKRRSGRFNNILLSFLSAQ